MMTNTKKDNGPKDPTRKSPVFIDELTPEQLDKELAKGYKTIEEGNTHSEEEVDQILKKDLGL